MFVDEIVDQFGVIIMEEDSILVEDMLHLNIDSVVKQEVEDGEQEQDDGFGEDLKKELEDDEHEDSPFAPSISSCLNFKLSVERST